MQTTKEIIQKCKKVHGEKYDYSQVDYKGDAIKISIICKIHGIFNQTPGCHIRSKQGCPKCSIINQANKQRKSLDLIVKQIEDVWGIHYFDFSETKYVNAHTKIRVKCNKHNLYFESHPGSIYKKYIGCNKCNLERYDKKHSDIWINKFIEIGNKIHLNKYDYTKLQFKDRNSKLEIICPKHGSFFQSRNEHIYGKSGCPVCNYSKGEHEICRILNDYNISYIPQHKVKINNSNHYYDFYLPNYNLIIEFNGKQHYEPVKWFGCKNKKQMLNAFNYVTERDKIKYDYCLNHNIRLLVIPYTEQKNILEILKNNLKLR